MNIDKVDVESLLIKSENVCFDRKSGKIELKKLAEILVAFANTNGGVVAIGITDKKFTGIKGLGEIKINDFIQAGYDHCIPRLAVYSARRVVEKENGEKDEVILLEVHPSEDKVYATTKDKVFIRIGDETKEIDFEQRKQLEYERGGLSFEIEPSNDCLLSDLDEELITKFKEIHQYEKEDIWNLLFSRGLAKRINGTDYLLNNAAIALFCNYPTVFLPNAKVRFIRYDGNLAQTGTKMNVIKNITIEGPIPSLIKKAIDVVKAQLREFNFLSIKSGKFEKVSEYPEDAWIEGIVNALIHRSYNISGDDIRIMMFEDRLEIQSPGNFPSIVNPKNIRDVHFSKNPVIARTMNEFGWVREFGEGVDRMYNEMETFFLDDPVFEEKNNTVKLTLKNNIYIRRIRQSESIETKTNVEWEQLSLDEQRALSVIYNKGKVRTSELAVILDKSPNTSRKILDKLVANGILKNVANSQTDPLQYYIFIEDVEL
ncbi:ATP-binding protein [Carnobacterium gallinarum]|uniref:ATP-binding protein n=1 Tax=Carnobacterium gallinarum TaxID=2749 RepID=UPI00054E0D8A|nr:ATP-binding protein [Carnobacterium gallinarum]